MAQHPDRSVVQSLRIRQPCECKGRRGVGRMGIVDDDFAGSNRFRGHDLQPAVGIAHNRLLTLGAEHDRFAIHQANQFVIAAIGVLEDVECTVIEDVAVLVYLQE